MADSLMLMRSSRKYGLMLHRLIKLLDKKLGIAVDLAWVVREGQIDTPDYALPEGYDIHEITQDHAPQLEGITRRLTANEVIRRLQNGHFGMMVQAKDGAVAGFTWANPNQVHDEDASYQLANGEAYLYDTHVVQAHRGNRLASRVRATCYDLMRAKGYRSFVSISDRFNLPSVKFKQRLGAKPERLYIKLSLLKKPIFFSILKSRYDRFPRAWRD